MCAMEPMGWSWSSVSMVAPMLGSVLLTVLLLGVLGTILWWTHGARQRLHVQTVTLAELDPVGILRERFARGEIDIENLEERVSHLLRTMQASDESANNRRRD